MGFGFCFTWRRREGLLVPSEISQVRAAQMKSMLYGFIRLTLWSVNLDTGVMRPRYGICPLVSDFSGHVYLLCLFILCSVNQHLQSTHYVPGTKRRLARISESPISNMRFSRMTWLGREPTSLLTFISHLDHRGASSGKVLRRP